MEIPYSVVDAFTDRPFHGNPAGVCLLEEWPEDGVLQHIAYENNLSETAFLVGGGASYDLRWFTPTVEIGLCGHATLASAFLLFSGRESGAEKLSFQTKSGALFVTKKNGRFYLNFPARTFEPAEPPAVLARALGAAPAEYVRSKEPIAVFESEEQVRNLKPDFSQLRQVEHGHAVIVTAPGKDCDFVSRFFAPKIGINEDPVTGSSHTMLIPYWSRRLHKTKLFARQLSARGGELWCEDGGERVFIGGNAVLYSEGLLHIR